VADDEVHQAHELRDEEDERENGEAQKGVGDDLAANVSIEQAHSSAPHILAPGAFDWVE
jgi:hypothetical protein